MPPILDKRSLSQLEVSHPAIDRLNLYQSIDVKNNDPTPKGAHKNPNTSLGNYGNSLKLNNSIDYTNTKETPLKIKEKKSIKLDKPFATIDMGDEKQALKRNKYKSTTNA